MSADRGKWAQKQAQDYLEARSTRVAGFAFHRYPDAKAARGALTSQPADYLVGTAGVPYHLEVKETAEAKRLPKRKISQFGALMRFHWAGFKTVVLVFRSAFNDWVYFTDDDLFYHETTPASFVFPTRSFPNAQAALDQALT
jgi:hypothetical protein